MARVEQGIYEVVNARNGTSIEITELWKARKCVVVFLRQFGCRFCKQQVAGLTAISSKLAKQEIALIAIGIGTQAQAKEFQERSEFPGELFIDPHSQAPQTYDLFKLNRGKEFLMAAEGEQGFGPYGVRKDVFELAEKAVQQGFEDDAPENWTGNTSQIGGTFVLGPGNSCDFAHRSRFVGDLADLTEVLEAATGENSEGAAVIYPSTKKWSKQLNLMEKFQPTSPRGASKQDTDANTRGAFDSFGSQTKVLSIGIALSGVAFAAVGSIVAIIALICTVAAAAYLKFHKNGKKLQSYPEITLYTPNDIDALAVEAGMEECDCSFIANADWSTLMIDASTKASFARSRARSRTLSMENEESMIGSKSKPKDVHQLSHQPSLIIDSGVNMESEIATGAVTKDDILEFQKATCYFREFLAKGHPDLGRKGPTCPFVPLALKRNSMYMATVRTTGDTTPQQVERVAKTFVTRYNTLEPRSGKLEVYKAVLLIFPNVPIQHAKQCIDDVQAKLKKEFVTKGLMIGEFHLRNNASGLRNPNFYPLRTATPCLAIRRIVPSDIAFLDMTKYDADTRVQFLESYMQQFEPDPHSSCPASRKISASDKKSVDAAKLALDQARQELEEQRQAHP
jgi:hypothetical protein